MYTEVLQAVLSAKPAYTASIEWLPEFFPGGKGAGALRWPLTSI
jgi:hypothetical protein